MENPCITIKRFNNDYKTLQIITQDSSEAVFIVKFSWLQKNVGADISQFIKDIRGISVLVYLDTDKLDLVLPMFNQGVQGFFTEHITKEEFGYCLDELLAGRTFFSQDLIPLLLTSNKTTKTGPTHPIISQRESEILKLIIAGYTNKEIAAKLYLSARTVEGHRARLLQKFDVRNTAELVFEATRNQEVA
jgi:DNA-binding NarL/FixJ family response regulator